MKRMILFAILVLCNVACSDDRIIVSPNEHYKVIDLKYNEPVYFSAKGGAIMLLPNNQAIILYNYKEVKEYNKIKTAAEYTGTFKAEIGSVSDLTANAFIIKYEELGGKYKLKEIDIECSN